MLAAELLISGAAAAVVCVAAKPLAAAVGLLDRPDGARKQHRGDVPMLGGLAVLPGLVWSFVSVEAIVAIALFYYCLGLLDDLFRISALFRLVFGGMVIVLTLIYAPELVIRSLSFFAGGDAVVLGALAIPFTCVCILGFVNAVNMVDGTNGLLIGLSTLWTGVLLFHLAPSPDLSVVGLGTELVVTLACNLRGRIFLGDSGACMLGVAIAAATIWVYNVSPTLKADTVAILFVVPVIDCLRVMCTRIVRGHSPVYGDRNHLHQLLALRWPRGVLPIYWSLVGVPSVLAVWLPDLTLVWFGACLLAYAGLCRAVRRPTGAAVLTAADGALPSVGRDGLA